MTGPGIKTAAEILAELDERVESGKPRGPGRRRSAVREHGSTRGVGQHRLRSEPLCEPCQEHERRRRADGGLRAKAWRAAMRRLAAQYPAEFRRLHNEEKRARGL